MTRPTLSTSTPPSVEDAWAAKIVKLRARKPAETFLTIPDEDALAVVAAKREGYLQARTEARKALPDAGSLSSTEVEAFLSSDVKVKRAHTALEKAVTDAGEAEVTFHFRALPPDAYEALQGEHPPTDAQAARDMLYNTDTYIPALISLSSVMPLTVDDALGLITPDPATGAVAFNQGDVLAIVQTIRDVNERPRMMLGKGSRPTPD